MLDSETKWSRFAVLCFCNYRYCTTGHNGFREFYYGGESTRPTNERRSNGKETTVYSRYRAKMLAALRRVKPDGYGTLWLSLIHI